MDDKFEGNHDFESPDIFSELNNYVLLFLSLTCVLSSIFIQSLFLTAGQMRMGMIVGPMLGVVLPIFVVTQRFPAGFGKQLLIRVPRPTLTFYVVLATFFVVVIVDHIYVLSQRFIPTPPDYLEGLEELKPLNVREFAATYLGLCVVAPVAEEIIFRGVIQRVFSRNMDRALAIVLAGFLFGAIHLAPHALVVLVLFGIYLGYIFHVTANLTYSIFGHSILNTVALVELMQSSEEEPFLDPFYLYNYWILGGSIAMLIFLLVKISKRASD